MKRFSIRPTVAACALVLLTASAIADAACRPNSCWQQYQTCIANGGGGDQCYTNYELCLYRNGCPVP
jgi:hypothetical protein